MGNGKLLIGVGLGDAGVNNPQPAIAQFANIVNQQRQQRLANQQALMEQAGNINPNGIREADRNDYMDKYNDWKQSAIAANNLPQNSRERMSALFDAQGKFGALNSLIGQSKQESQREHQLAMDQIQNPHLFTQEAHDATVKSMQTPMSGAGYIPSSQYGTLQRYIDPVKLDEDKAKLNKAVLDRQQWSDPIQSQGVDKLGNKTGVVIHNERSVDPAALLESHLHLATINHDVQTDLQRRYGDIQGANPQETLAMRVRQDLLDRGDLTADKNGQLVSGVKEATKPTFKADKAPDLFYQHYQYELAHPKAGIAVANQPTPSQTLITDMQKGTPGTGEKLLSLIPHGQYGSQKPAIGIDKVTGEHVFTYPAQIEPNKKNIEANNTLRANAKLDGNKVDPQDLLPETIVKQPGKVYKLNPNSPNYVADAAQMAKEQNINLTQLNQIEGIKGGHGQIDAAKGKVVATPTSNSMITVKLPNGQTGQVPLNKYEDFKKKYPQAQRVQ